MNPDQIRAALISDHKMSGEWPTKEDIALILRCGYIDLRSTECFPTLKKLLVHAAFIAPLFLKK